MELVVAVIGVKALYFLFAWLISTIIASYLSGRKGYGERIGLAFGLILAPIGAIIWLFWPAKPDSDWKVIGPFGRPKVQAEDAPPPAAHRPTGGEGVSA
jgi:fucose permease